MTDSSLDAALAALVTPDVLYFPIRHHSPACARHLERAIRARQPASILIEGPSSFTSLIPLILHAETKAPFAVYTSVRRAIVSDVAPGPPRHAAYFPFCDYSPELVALRVGAELGATLKFVDLDYADQVDAKRTSNASPSAPRAESLLEERHFKRSRYLQQLARRAGCRDHNDLWDHLFETRIADASMETFVRDVAAWCHFARVEATDDELAADGTLARELAMASAVRAELDGGATSIIVVTGGFHTVALPHLVAAGAPAPTPRPRQTSDDAQDHLIRYSFEQLDALNGYAAGMPSPFYYDQLWHATSTDGTPQAASDLAARMLVDLGRLTRRTKSGVALSPADEIAALEQARRLAALRGHSGPTREDLLDGIRSCFVKGAMDAEGAIVMGLAHHAMTGTAIGDVPADAGVPPLVADVRRIAQTLRLGMTTTIKRKSALDLYRKTTHRRTSRFFHSLEFLDVPYAALAAGPNFVTGTDLDRLFEHWTYQWTPQTESQLIEASVYGATLEEAAANRLSARLAEMESAGGARNAAEAVAMLVSVCRMGLHRHAGKLMTWIAAQIDDDPSLPSLTRALGQLGLLWESREPLEAHDMLEIPALIQGAYGRAVFLLHNLADTASGAALETLESLISIQDLLRAERLAQHALDGSLFHAPLAKAITKPQCPALLVGGVSGLLHSDGRLLDAELLKLLNGYLSAVTSVPGDQTEFLTGLLRASRDLAWREPALVTAVDTLLAHWSDDEFIARIPHLRMAFAELTPRETDQVATVVAGLHQGAVLGALHRADVSEAEMIAASRLNAAVRRALLDDGLSAWTSA